ncbi:MAG: hypothetical protein DI623_07395 [Sphingomonas sanxanigenens]|jgi:hypothetical protein|uniref:Uncharacterized protein n=1 Tax=Sphingomonas sanxanigenens TaxID=397260 RepID=A0A2W5AD47_9SPHN|nr:MAG: hypothetical protein DI623_07395 [Sphingomonas sanxanigenens]
MDLSFARFDWKARGPATIPDISVLLAELAARQAASATAIAQASSLIPARSGDPSMAGRVNLFGEGVHRVSGSFHPGVAALLTDHQPT